MQIEITPEYLASQGLSPTFPERFWAKVNKTDGCWLWTASKHQWGYGQIGRWKEGDRPILAHVASWVLHFGPIPKGMCVCHSCDVPPCVRPDHLWLGTQNDNTQDKMRKGRYVLGRRYKGEQNGNHILTREDVVLIRHLYASGISQKNISDQIGTSQTNVSLIIRMVTWA